MTLADIRTLFEYTYWANHRLLEIVGGLSPEEFGKDLGSSHGGNACGLVMLRHGSEFPDLAFYASMESPFAAAGGAQEQIGTRRQRERG